MLQPAGLIFGTSENFVDFRTKLLGSFAVEEIVNLSALRFGLFRDAISPACILTCRPGGQTEKPIQYVCPKPGRTADDNYRVTVEPGDVHFVRVDEAQHDLLVWCVLRWGSRRDLAFIRRLLKMPNLASHVKNRLAKTRDGIIRGDRKKRVRGILNRPILKDQQFPGDVFLLLDGSALARNHDSASMERRRLTSVHSHSIS